MSASRLETVRRVAVLRTAAARAAVGAAGVRRDTAVAHHTDRMTALSGNVLPPGSAGEVVAGLDAVARLAQAVTDAAGEVLLREQERTDALAGWSDAARRARLLEDVCARQRAEREATAELRAQHLLDDLAGRRAPEAS